jgi:hypothetical protein
MDKLTSIINWRFRMNIDFKNGWRWIVWVGGNDNYYKHYADAKRDYYEWLDKGYDDVAIERIMP